MTSWSGWTKKNHWFSNLLTFGFVVWYQVTMTLSTSYDQQSRLKFMKIFIITVITNATFVIIILPQYTIIQLYRWYEFIWCPSQHQVRNEDKNDVWNRNRVNPLAISPLCLQQQILPDLRLDCSLQFLLSTNPSMVVRSTNKGTSLLRATKLKTATYYRRVQTLRI